MSEIEEGEVNSDNEISLASIVADLNAEKARATKYQQNGTSAESGELTESDADAETSTPQAEGDLQAKSNYDDEDADILMLRLKAIKSISRLKNDSDETEKPKKRQSKERSTKVRKKRSSKKKPVVSNKKKQQTTTRRRSSSSSSSGGGMMATETETRKQRHSRADTNYSIEDMDIEDVDEVLHQIQQTLNALPAQLLPQPQPYIEHVMMPPQQSMMMYSMSPQPLQPALYAPQTLYAHDVDMRFVQQQQTSHHTSPAVRQQQQQQPKQRISPKGTKRQQTRSDANIIVIKPNEHEMWLNQIDSPIVDVDLRQVLTEVKHEGGTTATAPISDCDNEKAIDEDISSLREHLLKELSVKRTLKQQEEENEKNMKIIKLANEQIEEIEEKLSTLNKQQQRDSLMANATQQQQVTKRISPIIIRLGVDDDEDDDDEYGMNETVAVSEVKDAKTVEHNSVLQENISRFLNVIKENAKQQQQEPIPAVSIDQQAQQAVVTSSPTKRAMSRKDDIKTIRDRINIKSKTIEELSRKSFELTKTIEKKTGDVDMSRDKIRLLSEQLRAAEKVLEANEMSLKELKQKQRAVDAKLKGLKMAKKKQQESLQLLLKSVPQQPTVQKCIKTNPPPLPPPQIPQPTPPPPPPTTTPPVVTTVAQVKALSDSLKSLIENSKLKSLKSVRADSGTTATITSVNQTAIYAKTNSIKPNIIHRKQTAKLIETMTLNKYNANISSTQNQQIVSSSSSSTTTPLTPAHNGVHVAINDYHCPFIYVKLIDFYLYQLTVDNRTAITMESWFNVNESAVAEATATTPATVESVEAYRSPLLMFKSYRFNPNYLKSNQFEEAYSRFYCHTIDIRRPFCPFDLNGSCKDSNCVYQHSSVMQMDNLQRTEHLLSYCPKLIGVTENLSQKESLKRLKNYSKTFMSNNLNKMSIKDYFKYIYDHIEANTKFDESKPKTLLQRLPSLKLNSNKCLDAFSESYEDTSKEAELQSRYGADLKSDSRVNEFKFKYLTSSGDDSLKAYLHEKQEDVDFWLFYAKHSFLSGNIELTLNVLSQSLEYNCQSEALWLEYLSVYHVSKHKDYHELCLLAIDNSPTYAIYWKVILSVGGDYVNEILVRYENYLMKEMPVTGDASGRSFYLCEYIIYNVNLKLVQTNDLQATEQLFLKYLKSEDINELVDTHDLCVLWLYAIYLNAFHTLPTLFMSYTIPGRVVKLVPFMMPWSLCTKFKCDLSQLRQLLFDSIRLINQKVKDRSTDHHVHAIPIYENLILLELTLKRHDIALKLCDRFIKINSSLIHLILLKLHIAVQLAQGTRQVFESVLDAYPTNAQIHLFIAQYHVSINSTEAAVGVLTSLIRNQHNEQTDVNINDLYRQSLSSSLDAYSSQRLHLHLSYCLYLTLTCTNSTEIHWQYKKLIETCGDRIEDYVTIWLRYLKYVVEHEPSKLATHLNACLTGLSSKENLKLETKSYYELIIVESVLKLFQSNTDKLDYFRWLVNVLPFNCDLFKMYTHFVGCKKNCKCTRATVSRSRRVSTII